MAIEIDDSGDIRKLLDTILLNQKKLTNTEEVRIGTVNGNFAGQLSYRTSQFLVLKTNTRRKAMSGDHKGAEIYSNQFISLSSITAVAFDTFD